MFLIKKVELVKILVLGECLLGCVEMIAKQLYVVWVLEIVAKTK